MIPARIRTTNVSAQQTQQTTHIWNLPDGIECVPRLEPQTSVHSARDYALLYEGLF
jgi:hypothetical protein